MEKITVITNNQSLLGYKTYGIVGINDGEVFYRYITTKEDIKKYLTDENLLEWYTKYEFKVFDTFDLERYMFEYEQKYYKESKKQKEEKERLEKEKEEERRAKLWSNSARKNKKEYYLLKTNSEKKEVLEDLIYFRMPNSLLLKFYDNIKENSSSEEYLYNLRNGIQVMNYLYSKGIKTYLFMTEDYCGCRLTQKNVWSYDETIKIEIKDINEFIIIDDDLDEQYDCTFESGQVLEKYGCIWY